MASERKEASIELPFETVIAVLMPICDSCHSDNVFAAQLGFKGAERHHLSMLRHISVSI